MQRRSSPAAPSSLIRRPRPSRRNFTSSWVESRWNWPGSKKKSPATTDDKRALVEPGHPQLSVRRQCELLGLSRSAWYYEAATASAENLQLMRLIDEEYTRHPVMGRRRMTRWLRVRGHAGNVKRVSRLTRVLGIAGLSP